MTTPKNLFSHIKSSSGQIAIFIAMIFQVLFILFAMAINVALVVHDKINLQNSVDLAAYYAASKQSEMLNIMAHQNYQIRQAWKLFGWRYRVLGTMGMERAGSAQHPTITGEKSESIYNVAVAPSLCVSYFPTWDEVPKGMNLCHKVDLKVPPLPQVKVFAGFLGLNHQVAALSTLLIKKFHASCERHGAFNWWFAMSIAHAYRLDQRNRRQTIYGLANNLSGSPDGDFIDLNGDSVKAGALKTFVNNLTFENRRSFEQGGSFEMLNSLAGVDPQVWLPFIPISPTVAYVDVKEKTPVDSGCEAITSEIGREPRRSAAREFLRAPPPTGLGASDLIPWKDAMAAFLKDDYQFTLGVEKNPWFMAYMGIRATSAPRQIFFPFGPNLEIRARAYAKPFGGRMGPWHGSAWPKGSLVSVGEQTDKLVPERTKAGGLLDSPQDPRRLPNHSRFPGDTMGLTSKLAQNSMIALSKAEGGSPRLQSRFGYYQELKVEFAAGRENDKLAWNYNDNKYPTIRNYELSALAPDLFDITYYSIEPNYSVNYLPKLKAIAAKIGMGSLVLRPDLGHHGKEMESYSVQDQINHLKSVGIRRSEAFFFVRNNAHMLTAWTSDVDYGVFAFPTNFFGKCGQPDTDFKVKVPGSCAAMGGRTGYSIKLISRDYLNSDLHPMGGPQEPPGSLMNPPNTFGEGW